MNLRTTAIVHIENGVIRIEIPIKVLIKKKDVIREANWSVLKLVYGMWRNKKADAVEYQRAVRKDWD
jgi:hypothetical protein